MLNPGLREIHETLIELPRSENQRPDRDGPNRRNKEFERPIVYEMARLPSGSNKHDEGLANCPTGSGRRAGKKAYAER